MKPNKKTTGLQPISIDADLHRKLKVKCVQLGSTMREFVERLIREALEKRGNA